MRFDVLTLFPGLIESVTDSSIVGRAKKEGLIEVFAHDIRDFSTDRHRRVDDTPYGGGMGMLMAAPPVCDCFDSVWKNCAVIKIYVILQFVEILRKVLSTKYNITLSFNRSTTCPFALFLGSPRKRGAVTA